mmetsp:Transcript_73814/g.130400  ORF Transcript_73814/g.130400 Transcript_73814/m.130400 type:complete len:164 (+) Transcript_73814:79-570(+)|eukprot:CAMPEP_0197662034 /NCGR_PEP_ID=MMETSP1338-20131121/51924_1 /TAXON_ID=43686 ORGANISM="Pelagodinium beii, Strain RCC1491" /NCGR_SAMPLE_ID=MMETSP1338 /ASSEMBLY_ACC=CAM_ASM_000754 /LENGTH=163 /DNA_ID=CAMNT_0043239713 /DNA_START=53 /DNA_END=544 /DNA_ORIENTATION=+
MSFAANLTKIVASKRSEAGDREKIAQKWHDVEEKLLEEALELFKARCTREAEQQKCEATISFEVLTREIEDFPKRALEDSTYIVESWPSGSSAESWFYATKGPSAPYTKAPILFAEVLQGMLPKFVDQVKDLGFQEANHEAGTWKITASWAQPEESAKKRRKD